MCNAVFLAFGNDRKQINTKSTTSLSDRETKSLGWHILGHKLLMDREYMTPTIIFVCAVGDETQQTTSQTSEQGSQTTVNPSTPIRKQNQSQIENSSLSLGVLFFATAAQWWCSTDLTAASHASSLISHCGSLASCVGWCATGPWISCLGN